MFSFQKIVFPIFLFFLSCQSPKSENAQEIIQKALHQSGFDKSSFSVDFDFRNYHYTFIRKPSFYSFSRSTIQKDVEVKDVMTSSKPLQRFIDGKMILLSDSLQRVYSNSLNSVMYFFQLPKPLQDTAAINELVGAVVIHGETYWTLKVTFKEEGGGEDFQDEYRYWINQKNHEIDYLAYNYLTDGGGTRFRRAVNKRKIEGIFFQDYVNYKSFQKFEQLDSLPSLFEKKELKQVSLIENKNIRVVK
jgi:hypothetical protein